MNSRSPSIVDVSRSKTRSLATSPSIARSASAEPRRATPPDQKLLPITDASWIARFSAGVSRSMRDAITPCTVSGRREGRSRTSSHRPSLRAIVASSIIIRRSSAAKNGLPSDRARIGPTISAGAWPPSMCSISWVPSAGDRADSEIAVASESPPPQPGRRSNRSGRAMHTTRIRPAARATTDSTSSNRLGSAQCTSSISTTSAESSASDSRYRCHARATDRWAASRSAPASGSVASSTPIEDSSTFVTPIPSSPGNRGSSRSRAFAIVASAESLSMMPASVRRISASGQ